MTAVFMTLPIVVRACAEGLGVGTDCSEVFPFLSAVLAD